MLNLHMIWVQSKLNFVSFHKHCVKVVDFDYTSHFTCILYAIFLKSEAVFMLHDMNEWMEVNGFNS